MSKELIRKVIEEIVERHTSPDHGSEPTGWGESDKHISAYSIPKLIDDLTKIFSARS